MRPVENITMAPKSQEVSQIQQNMHNRNQANQANISGGFANEVKKNSQQTVKTSKGENNQFLYDAKNKGNGNFYKDDKRKKDKTSKENEQDNEIKTSNFDVKI